MRVEERLSEPLARLVGRTVEEDQLSRLQEKVKSTTFLVELVRTLEMTKDASIQAWATRMHEKDATLSVEDYAEAHAVEYLQRRILVSRTSTTGFEIVVSDLDPDRACLLAQHITNRFVSSSTREQLDEIRAMHDFSVEQIVIYKQKLDDAESALQRYQSGRVARHAGREPGELSEREPRGRPHEPGVGGRDEGAGAAHGAAHRPSERRRGGLRQAHRPVARRAHVGHQPAREPREPGGVGARPAAAGRAGGQLAPREHRREEGRAPDERPRGRGAARPGRVAGRARRVRRVQGRRGRGRDGGRAEERAQPVHVGLHPGARDGDRE